MCEPSDDHCRILAVIQRIPPGHVSTYGDVARLAGLPGRARLVGRVLRDAPSEWRVPWHRVVNAGGRISPRADREEREQRRLLSAEGIDFDDHDRLDLTRHRWRP